MDALRIANRMSDQRFYDWILLGDGKDSFMFRWHFISPDNDLIELKRDDIIMLCGGIDVQANTSKKLLSG